MNKIVVVLQFYLQMMDTLPHQIKVLGGFVVQADGQTDVVLDFDAEKSLVKLGNNNWLLKPVIVKK